MAKKETLIEGMDYGFGYGDLAYYQECVQRFKTLMSKYPELKMGNALGNIARCNADERQNCGTQGVMSQQDMKKELEAKGEDVSKAPTDEQLEKIEKPIIEADKMDFRILEFDPAGDPPRVPPLFDESLKLVTGGPQYDKYLQDCKDAYLVQSAVLAKMIDQGGVDFIKTLSPKVIANQGEAIRESLSFRHEKAVEKVDEKIDVLRNGWDQTVKQEDGTEKVEHHRGIEDCKAASQAAREEYDRLKTMVKEGKDPSGVPFSKEQIAKLRSEMAEQTRIRKEANAQMVSLSKELKEVTGERADLLSEKDKEDKKVEKIFDKRAVRKAEKILKGDVKERVTLSQRFEIAKMNFQNKVEDIRQDNEGQLVRPVLKAAGQTVVSGISKGFKHIVDKVRGKFADKSEDKDQEDRDVEEWNAFAEHALDMSAEEAAELLDDNSAQVAPELTDEQVAENMRKLDEMEKTAAEKGPDEDAADMEE